MKHVQRITQFMSGYADKIIPRFERANQSTLNLSPCDYFFFQNIQLLVKLQQTVGRVVIGITSDDYQSRACVISRPRAPSGQLTGLRPIGRSPHNLTAHGGTAFRPEMKQRHHLCLGVLHKGGKTNIAANSRQLYHAEAGGVSIRHDSIRSHYESGFGQTSYGFDVRNCISHIDGQSSARPLKAHV